MNDRIKKEIRGKPTSGEIFDEPETQKTTQVTTNLTHFGLESSNTIIRIRRPQHKTQHTTQLPAQEE
jgi:hypothetical protein